MQVYDHSIKIAQSEPRLVLGFICFWLSNSECLRYRRHEYQMLTFQISLQRRDLGVSATLLVARLTAQVRTGIGRKPFTPSGPLAC
jgi:hypothetical protein